MIGSYTCNQLIVAAQEVAEILPAWFFHAIA